MKIHVKDRMGHIEAMECAAGELLMRVLVERDLVEATCGGECSCGTCQVYVDSSHLERLPAPGVFERDLIAGLTNASASSRLSCQITLTDELDGMALEIAKPE